MRRALAVHGAAIGRTQPTLLARHGWAYSPDLRPGWRLATADGRQLVVERVAVVQQPTPVYNLTVADTHTYFVGDLSNWAHNSCPWQALDDHAKAVGANLADDTVAILEVNGKRLGGVNNWARGQNLVGEVADDVARQSFAKTGFLTQKGKMPRRQFANHAEGEAFLAHWIANGAEAYEAATGELYVSRTICKACASHIRTMARSLGINKLFIKYLDDAGNIVDLGDVLRKGFVWK